jgi:MFS transporter, SP family, sugar:H+ symporter
MGGFIFGYDTGQISGILETPNFLQLFGQYGTKPDGSQGYYFSNVRSGLIVSLLSIGTLIGALIAAPIADRFGRKWSIISWTGMFSIGVVIQVASEGPNWVQIVMGRWVAGLGVGALSLLVPMYQSEISPRHIRGALVRCVFP